MLYQTLRQGCWILILGLMLASRVGASDETLIDSSDHPAAGAAPVHPFAQKKAAPAAKPPAHPPAKSTKGAKRKTHKGKKTPVKKHVKKKSKSTKGGDNQ